ncbi:MAG: hypothetical protein LCH61_14580 [Proteobacteria bacterium]|nr:hypothetical protein [Pseudomonadota bacterium]
MEFIASVKNTLLSKLAGPKDYFERQKRRYALTLFFPAFTLLAGPSIVSNVLGAIKEGTFTGSDWNFRVLGERDSDQIFYVILLIFFVFFLLAINLYYSRILHKIEIKMKNKSYKEDEKIYTKFIFEIKSCNNERQKIALIKQLFNLYPTMCENDPIFIKEASEFGLDPCELMAPPKQLTYNKN